MITQGDWEIKGSVNNKRDSIFWHTTIVCGGKQVARTSGIGIDESVDNARLITEAGNFCNQTGFTPKQLADHRAALLAACEKTVDHLNYPPKNMADALHAGIDIRNVVQAAIAKAESN